MSKAGALDLASGLGGKLDKNEVLSAVEKYEKYHVCYGGEEEERKANYTDMVNKYYDLVTSFYEFGWGESFHFAPRWNGESLRESIKRHEHFLALQLDLKPGHKVLDVGCGIGGPLREIARFSYTSITGLNNNEYQISRGKELNRVAKVDKTCDFVKADFMKMPFPDNSFDAVYAIEATCHAPDAYGCYKEIYRVLKPGQHFAAYEWCMTDAFDSNNQEHQKIKAEIEIGDGLPDIRLTGKCLEALKQAGFEVVWERDLAVSSPVPWYLPLDKSHFSLSSFRLTAIGRFITKNMVKVLEFVRLAPKGSQRVQDFLEKAAEGLVEGGKAHMATEMDVEQRETINNVMILLTDPEGTPLGAPMYLPQNAGPQQLQQMVNKLLSNEEKLPYAFYISDQELLVSLGAYLEKNKVSVEKVLTVVYQPQAVFRIRPVSRCSATISGHAEAVLSVSFSPDGRQLASGSGDTTVRLWDLNTQTPMFTCTGHKNWVLSIAWSPDGKHLVSGSKAGELFCWDPQTGKPLGNPLTGHKKWITGVSWEPLHLSAPCRRFVSSSKDGDARIWDVSLKKCVICLSGHTLAITCVKWGGDGVIYTGSQDCTIKVWETKQGKLIRELKGHGHWVNSLALSTEYVLRTGAFDHTGKQFSSPEEMKKVALERYNKMKGNAPERLVSGSDDFTMFLWEPAVSKHPKTRMTGHQQLVNHVYFSPDGQWVASASFDKSVKLWNGITGKFVAAFRGHVAPVYQISWSADSRLLLSGSKDSTLKIWDIRTRKLKEDLPGHADEVFAVDWSPDGEKVASGGKDKVLKLWMG